MAGSFPTSSVTWARPLGSAAPLPFPTIPLCLRVCESWLSAATGMLRIGASCRLAGESAYWLAALSRTARLASPTSGGFLLVMNGSPCDCVLLLFDHSLPQAWPARLSAFEGSFFARCQCFRRAAPGSAAPSWGWCFRRPVIAPGLRAGLPGLDRWNGSPLIDPLWAHCNSWPGDRARVAVSPSLWSAAAPPVVGGVPPPRCDPSSGHCI